jgi:hypothetical protein
MRNHHTWLNWPYTKCFSQKIHTIFMKRGKHASGKWPPLIPDSRKVRQTPLKKRI